MNRKILPLLLWLGLVLSLVPPLLWSYLLNPIPGSQELESFAFSYYLDKYLWLTNLLGWALLAGPLLAKFRSGRVGPIVGGALIVLLAGGAFYLRGYVMNAERMFYVPTRNVFLKASQNPLPSHLAVLGVSYRGVHRAYPMYLLSYHHQIYDTLAGQPLLVTYCIVCRSARVFEPQLNGMALTFRLVGMNHYNAILQDHQTGSWWRQARGVAEFGPLAGKALPEWPCEQMSLDSWLKKHPDSDIFQPDVHNPNDVARFATFDRRRAPLDTDGWQPWDWVVGVEHAGQRRAYPWRELVQRRVLNDTLAAAPLVVALEPDSVSFHVWSRQVNGAVLTFAPPADSLRNAALLVDVETGSHWDGSGTCVAGVHAGQRLAGIRAWQEYWHSWKRFHPTTTQFLGP